MRDQRLVVRIGPVGAGDDMRVRDDEAGSDDEAAKRRQEKKEANDHSLGAHAYIPFCTSFSNASRSGAMSSISRAARTKGIQRSTCFCTSGASDR